MSSPRIFFRARCLLSAMFVFCLATASFSSAQPYILETNIADTALIGSHYNVLIPFYLKNLEDSVGGFDFRIQSSDPATVRLQNTVIYAGTLTREWEVMRAQFVELDGDTVLRVWGLADWITIPAEGQALFYPQYGAAPLFYLRADVVPSSDSVNRRVSLEIVTKRATDFIVSDQIGFTIGTHPVLMVDTTFLACAVWYGEDCLEWVEVPGPPADSVDLYYYTQYRIDSSVTLIKPGVIDVGYHRCGDLTGADNKVNLADISAMISYVYLHGPAPYYLWSPDVDGSHDGKVNLVDITSLSRYVYMNGPLPDCYEP